MARLRFALAFLLAAPILAPSPARAGDPKVIPDDRHQSTVEERYEPQQFRNRELPNFRRIIPLLAGPAGEIGSAGLPGNQSETSTAASGLSVVVGYNDSRGFGLGIMYSTDGGVTFNDAGLLPLDPGYDSGGDPGVAVWNPLVGPPVFYCTSILYHPSGDISFALHRSTDGGMTWSVPFVVTPSQVPSTEFPDREAIAVDPETGRLLLAWTHFGATVTMRVTYSDDAATGSPPTWAPATFVGTRPQDGQATTIVANPVNTEVYLAWQTYVGAKRDIAFARSPDNGTTWLPPTDTGPQFFAHQCPWGFDRWLWSFSGSTMAYNPADGGLEMVYAASTNGTPAGDFGDIYYKRSTTGGASWTAPVPLNLWPNTHRPQANPCVSVTQDGRIDVFWYDLSSGSGFDDYTDIYYCFSTNFGLTWSSPVPVNPEPFHNEAGNDFGAPHQGDYNDAVSLTTASSTGYGAFAVMEAPSAVGNGADGLSFRAEGLQVVPLRLRPNTLRFDDFGCNDNYLTAGESADLFLPLENIGRGAQTGISATLTVMTPGIAVIGSPTRAYANVAVGKSTDPATPFAIVFAGNYPCGATARFRLDISAAGAAPTYCDFSLPTGVPTGAILLSENFDGVVPPTLPPGWSAVTLTGAIPSPWVTAAGGASSAPNAAFCSKPTTQNFERLEGPAVTVPATTDYVEVTFDVLYSLKEYDTRYGSDGITFDYQLDGVGGSHHSVGDAIFFEPRYSHNIARSSGNGAGDRSGWSGAGYPGYRNVKIRLAGLAGHTMTPRFQLTSEGIAGGTGVRVDNVQIAQVLFGCAPCNATDVAPAIAGGVLDFVIEGPNPSPAGTRLRFTLRERARVKVELFDVRGRRMSVLLDGQQDAGSRTLAIGTRQQALPPGVYFVRLQAGKTSRTLRVVALE